jgi:hypothetical protein
LTVQLGDPVLGFCERGGLGDIVDDECGLGIAIVHGCERGKTFLACRIPDLKLDGPRGEIAFLCEESSCSRKSGQLSETARTCRKRETWSHQVVLTAYCGLFVFLEVVVDEAHDK